VELDGTLLLIGAAATLKRRASFHRPLAPPVILLLWSWLSALVVLVGAEIDAELEHGGDASRRPSPVGGLE
jgi:uncharacterized BrkB/YihY/UPF0761 family membrane protein